MKIILLFFLERLIGIASYFSLFMFKEVRRKRKNKLKNKSGRIEKKKKLKKK